MAEKIEFDASGFQSLKAQIREANIEYQALLANIDATPEAVAAAAAKVANLKDDFNDANDAVNALTQQGKFQALTKGLAAVSGGFTAMQGAIGLVGGDVKDFEKTFQKLQAAMALTQGLTALADLGDAFGAIKVAAVSAFNGIKAAFGSTGVGLVILGVTALLSALIYKFTEAADEATKIKTADEAYKLYNQTLSETNSLMEARLGYIKATGTDERQVLEETIKIRKEAEEVNKKHLEDLGRDRVAYESDERLAEESKNKGRIERAKANTAALDKEFIESLNKITTLATATKLAEKELTNFDKNEKSKRKQTNEQANKDAEELRKKENDRKVRDLEAKKALALAEVDQDKLQAQGFAKTEADKIRIENEAAQKRIQIEVDFQRKREALRDEDDRSATALEARIQELGNQRVEADRKAQEDLDKVTNQGIADRRKAEEDAGKKAQAQAEKDRANSERIIDQHFLQLELDAKGEIKNKKDLNEELDRLERERAKKKLALLEEGSVEYLQALNAQADEEIATAERTTEEKLETLQKQVQATFDAANEVFNAQQAFNDRDQNREMEALKAKGLNEEQAAKETDEINRKYFEKNKEVQVGQAIINTLQSSISAFASLANIPVVGPVLGAIAASAALAAGYATVQKIQETTYTSSLKASSTQGSMYAEGGLLTGRSHDMGGIRTSMGELEGGEFVMNRRATANFLPLLESINSIGNTKGPEVAEAQQPIFKTYVVATEMSSQQEANAKLSALARM